MNRDYFQARLGCAINRLEGTVEILKDIPLGDGFDPSDTLVEIAEELVRDADDTMSTALTLRLRTQREKIISDNDEI